MTTLYFNSNMSSINELATESTVDTKITTQLAAFTADTVELFSATPNYVANSRVFKNGVVWISAAGVAPGQPAPDINNVDWKKQGDEEWLQKYDDAYIYDLNDSVFFNHSVIGEQFWKLTTSTDTVVNGAFAADTDWTKGTGWTIAAGVASKAAGTASLLSETVGTLTVTTRYRITYTISNFVAGTATVKAGSGTSGTARSANGTFTEELVAAGDTVLSISANSTADYDIDNVIALEAGISPEDDLVKWAPMLRGKYVDQYNETDTYLVGEFVMYTLGDGTQNGLYKCIVNTTASQDPVDTPASWDSQENIEPADVSPLTTKGDIWQFTTVDARLAVGGDGLVLTADAASAGGVKWNAVAGTGDVVGPSSATNLAIAKYSGTTGKLIQNSGIIIDASDNMTAVTSLETPLIVTASNADLVLTPNGTGVIKLGKDLNTNGKDVVTTSGGNMAFKPEGDGRFDIVYANPTVAGQFLCKTDTGIGKRLDFGLRGELSATDLVVSGGTNLTLENFDTTNGNYNVIQGRNKDSNISVSLVMANVNHASNQGEYRILTRNGSFNTGFIQNLDGHITKPLNSLFFAFNSATDSNVTGDGTVFTVVCNSEISDNNADYNTTTGVFTAPVTGDYKFVVGVNFDDIANGTTHDQLFIKLVTSNRNYRLREGDPSKDTNAVLGQEVQYNLSSPPVDMVAGDTASFTVNVNGGTKIVNVLGNGTNMITYFGGWLIG